MAAAAEHLVIVTGLLYWNCILTEIATVLTWNSSSSLQCIWHTSCNSIFGFISPYCAETRSLFTVDRMNSCDLGFLRVNRGVRDIRKRGWFHEQRNATRLMCPLPGIVLLLLAELRGVHNRDIPAAVAIRNLDRFSVIAAATTCDKALQRSRLPRGDARSGLWRALGPERRVSSVETGVRGAHCTFQTTSFFRATDALHRSVNWQ
jgi:hypothetical protein